MHARIWMGLLLVGVGCTSTESSSTGSSSSGASGSSTGSSGSTSAGSTGSSGVLPVGDGKWGTAAAAGQIYVCSTRFGGGGAFADGPWIFTDGGFTEDSKVRVQGAVDWPTHAFNVAVSGSTRNVTGNNLPDHATGTFPVSSSDPAYAYDRNPNSISAQSLDWALPANPAVAASPTCLTGGAIGVLLTGVVFFDALDAEGRDAVAHEVQDACDAHPERSGAARTTTTRRRRARLTQARATPPCSATRGTASASTGGAARTASRSTTQTWTSATATRTTSPGTARPCRCTSTTRPPSTRTRWAASAARPSPAAFDAALLVGSRRAFQGRERIE